MCDENNRIVVAVSLDHVAELSREGNIQPMQVSTQELFEIVEAENTGVMFIVRDKYISLISHSQPSLIITNVGLCVGGRRHWRCQR